MVLECSVLILYHVSICYHCIEFLLLHFSGHVLNSLENRLYLDCCQQYPSLYVMLLAMCQVLNLQSWWLESCITTAQQVFRKCIDWLYQTGWELNCVLSVAAVCLFDLSLVSKHFSILPLKSQF